MISLYLLSILIWQKMLAISYKVEDMKNIRISYRLDAYYYTREIKIYRQISKLS